MKWLNKTDPLVQCLVEPTGELVLVCVGELHLEITIKELQSFLNGIEVVVSSPIVVYHETVTTLSSKVSQ
jgi:translation elongation factor EF-G